MFSVVFVTNISATAYNSYIFKASINTGEAPRVQFGINFSSGDWKPYIRGRRLDAQIAQIVSSPISYYSSLHGQLALLEYVVNFETPSFLIRLNGSQIALANPTWDGGISTSDASELTQINFQSESKHGEHLIYAGATTDYSEVQKQKIYDYFNRRFSLNI